MNDCLRACRLVMSNKFNEAIELCQQWSDVSFYNCQMEAALKTLKAILTLERVILKSFLSPLIIKY